MVNLILRDKILVFNFHMFSSWKCQPVYQKVVEFNRLGANVTDGAFGENLLVDGIDCRTLPVGTRLQCGNVLLEITQIGKECHNGCAIFKRVGICIMPHEGIFARVLRGGEIREGDIISTAEEEARIG